MPTTAPHPLHDPVPDTAPPCAEIGFQRADYANCADILWQNLARNPNSVAVTGPLGTLSYAQLVGLAAAWGHGFLSMGLPRGARIAFFLDDTPSFAAAFYGAVRAGYVPVLLNTQTRPDLLNYFLQDMGAELAVVDASFLPLFTPEARAGTPLRRIIVANGAGPDDDTTLLAAEQFLAGQPSTLDAAPTHPNDMAFWMYSSGSTGRPKGIVHLHHDPAYIQHSFGAHVLRLRADDICYSVPKAYFAYGFGNSLVFPFAVGATAVLLPGRPDPSTVLGAIETYRPSVFFGLPTLFTALCGASEIEQRNLSSIRQTMSAAEILSAEVYAAWQGLTGHGPTEGLGSTEVLHVYLSNRLTDHRPGAAGARVPGYEIRLQTPEGHLAEPGQEGVMLVRGHSTAPHYWNRPDKTAETMRDDWIYTGDRFLEKDGYYYFQGRADDLIKISGQWVWPLEVERCLNDHPDVQECAVLAHQLPDQRMALRAVISLKAGRTGDAPMREALRAHVKQHLTPYKATRMIEFLPELPKTGTGKIDRQALTLPH